MEWNQLFSMERKPEPEQIAEHIGSPLWQAFCHAVEKGFGAASRIEHSRCSGAPGWNIKYRKSGRSLCTLYPRKGYFTCLVCIGPRECGEAELYLQTCTPYLRDLYTRSAGMNGTKWLMADVTDEAILRDILMLVSLRLGTQAKRG